MRVFYFDLRYGQTNNVETLSDQNYLLWDRKNRNMSKGDYCIIFIGGQQAILETKIVDTGLKPKRQEDNWYVEYKSKKYFYDNARGYEDFIVFGIEAIHETQLDLKMSGQGGTLEFTPNNDKRFYHNKLPQLIPLIENPIIRNVLNKLEKTNSSRALHAAQSINTIRDFDLLLGKKQVILYGPPGTGKTYRARQLAVEIIHPQLLSDPQVRESRIMTATYKKVDHRLFTLIQKKVANFDSVSDRTQNSMIGYYSKQSSTQRDCGLIWLEFPRTSSSPFTVHFRKESYSKYPARLIAEASKYGYSENGWGGYPEFVVRDEASANIAIQMAEYAYLNL